MNLRIVRFSILLADLVWLALGLYVAQWLRFGFQSWEELLRPGQSGFLEILTIASLVWPILYFWLRLDGFRGGWNFPAVFSQVISGVAVLLALVLAAAYLGKEFYSRLVILHYSYLLVVGLVGLRYFTRRMFQSKYLAAARKKVVILGSGSVARELALRIRRHPELLREVVGVLSRKEDLVNPALETEFLPGTQHLRSPDILEFLRQSKVEELLVAFPGTDPETSKLINLCRVSGIRVSLVPMFYELYISRPEFSEVDGLPLVSLQDFRLAGYMMPSKRVLDMILSSVVFLAMCPFLLVGVVVIQRQGRPAFKRVLRAGRNGQPFQMLRLNVDREALAQHLSLYESFLLRFSLTELPQLWNVLLGEMSLVGPRPESPERVKHYSDWQQHRLKLRPGVTGLAQVHGLREEHSSDEKTRFDLQYMLQWSPLLDISLILQTIWTLANRSLAAHSPLHSAAEHLPTATEAPPLPDVNLNPEVIHADRS